jgi:hypothetical protein
MDTLPAFTPLPVWTPQLRMTALGFTAEQHAIVDSETANRRIAMVTELRDRAETAERDGSPTAGMLRTMLERAVASAQRAQTRCTNSGALRTDCTTCDHSRQLELLAQAGAWKEGDYITWPGVEPDCYLLTGVNRFYITYEARDGYRATVDDTIGMSLADKIKDWQPATPEQIARFERLYQPAPSNWD